MSTEARQRRGNKAASADDGNSAPPTSASPPKDAKSQIDEGKKKLEDAMGRVFAARDRMDDLHSSWRSYLLRISLMVVLISVHQSQGPMAVCLGDVKEHNAYVETNGGGEAITFPKALEQVARNGLCDWVGIILSGLLAYFLSMEVPVGNFTPKPYAVATLLVFFQVSLYFQTKEIVGCAGRGWGGPGALDDIDSEVDDMDRKRQFPVAVVFHAIATVALWFMKLGRNKVEANAVAVAQLKKSLEAAEQIKKGKGKGK
eukprot:CAMPEP_0113554182 /NCGR_PEP_ID=MMETSP0015_2-20120614/16010_1 /TAXON_ID=2838 /ORGANISM="Odontella" /LENGTH=257 /DNA_ID=CAMNT_0000455301 /DNA_START=166 /DNA_END=939 /DNA_ORIENTATION=- /assembly_acc=CAM_ASM_000160